MRRGYWLAVALILGAVLGSLLLDDPGRVSIAAHGWLLQMSLPIAALVLLALAMLWGLLRRAWGFMRQRSHALIAPWQTRAYEQLAKGLTELAAGQWEQAEQTLSRSAFRAAHPAVHYLAAARAAELLGATARRDQWLAKAMDVAPEQRAAVHISHAEMLLRHNQLAAAQNLLEQLDTSGHQNMRGLSLLGRIYRQQGDWQKLKLLEPRLRRTSGVATAQVDELLAQVHLDMINAAATARDAALLTQAWRDVPTSLARQPEVVVAYARAAMACGQHELAEKVLRGLLNEQWHEPAVLAYGELEVAEPMNLLQTIEKWLVAHPQDAALLLTGARCCIRNELYGKARSYLEASIGMRPRLESYQLLAHLLELMGEREAAFRWLSEGLTHAVGRKPGFAKLRVQRLVERRKSDRRGGL